MLNIVQFATFGTEHHNSLASGASSNSTKGEGRYGGNASIVLQLLSRSWVMHSQSLLVTSTWRSEWDLVVDDHAYNYAFCTAMHVPD
jgi:hypothetical protein